MASSNIDIAKLLGFSLNDTVVDTVDIGPTGNTGCIVFNENIYISTIVEPTVGDSSSDSSSTPRPGEPTDGILVCRDIRRTSDSRIILTEFDHTVIGNNRDPTFVIPLGVAIGKEYTLIKFFLTTPMRTIRVELPNNTIIVGLGIMTMTEIPNFSRLIFTGVFDNVSVWMIV